MKELPPVVNEFVKSPTAGKEHCTSHATTPCTPLSSKHRLIKRLPSLGGSVIRYELSSWNRVWLVHIKDAFLPERISCAHTFAMTKFMIAVDGSNHSEKAYQIVNKLINDDEHDEIVFLSVISPMNHDNNDNNDNNEKDTTKVNRRKKKAEDLLCGWDKQAKDDGVTFLSFIYPSVCA